MTFLRQMYSTERCYQRPPKPKQVGINRCFFKVQLHPMLFMHRVLIKCKNTRIGYDRGKEIQKTGIK